MESFGLGRRSEEDCHDADAAVEQGDMETDLGREPPVDAYSAVARSERQANGETGAGDEQCSNDE